MSDRSTSSSPAKSPESPPKVVASVSDLALALGQVANVVSETTTSESDLLLPPPRQSGSSSSQDQSSDVPLGDSDDSAAENRRVLLQSLLQEPSIKPITRKSKKPASPSEAKASESLSFPDEKSMEDYLKRERAARLAATAHLRRHRGRADPQMPRGEIDNDAGGDPAEYQGPRMRYLVRVEDTRFRRELARRRAFSNPPLSDGQRGNLGTIQGAATQQSLDWPFVRYDWVLPTDTRNQPSTSTAPPPQFMEEPLIPRNWFMPLYTENQPSTSTAAQPQVMGGTSDTRDFGLPQHQESQQTTSSASPPLSIVEVQRSPSLSDWTVASTPPPSAVLAVNHHSPQASLVTASNSASLDGVAYEGGVEIRTTSESSTELRRLMNHPPSFTIWSSEENSQRTENSQSSDSSSDENNQLVENPSDENSQLSENSSNENSQPVENPSDEIHQPVEDLSARPNEEPLEEAVPIAAVDPQADSVHSPQSTEYEASLSDDAMSAPPPKRRRTSDDSL